MVGGSTSFRNDASNNNTTISSSNRYENNKKDYRDYKSLNKYDDISSYTTDLSIRSNQLLKRNENKRDVVEKTFEKIYKKYVDPSLSSLTASSTFRTKNILKNKFVDTKFESLQFRKLNFF